MPRKATNPEGDIYWQAVRRWQAQPTPENARYMLETLEPVLSQALYASLGPNYSPLLKSRAKLMALEALRRYNPQMGRVNTFLVSQLQGLRRYRRQVTTPFRVSEQRQIDYSYVMDAQEELRSRLGREPTLKEISAYTHLPLRRIERSLQVPAYVSESSIENAVGEEDLSSVSTIGAQDARRERLKQQRWLETVYHELGDPVNQKIMEWRLGLFGRPKLPNQEIAKRLKITPSAVSQRWSKINQFINDLEELKPI